MRLWSVHPEYLDAKGLVALWREALLARHVLGGNTKGYRHHPQLNRFKSAGNPVHCINQYLSAVYYESVNRGYNFDKTKIDWDFDPVKLPVTRGQINFESQHLQRKLKTRDRNRYNKLINRASLKQNPLFEIIDGDVEEWEIIK